MIVQDGLYSNNFFYLESPLFLEKIL